jgi:hypothetical protein
MTDGIDNLETMVARLTAENARLRAEVESLRSELGHNAKLLTADLARVTADRDALVVALDAAARSLEWIASYGIRDEDPESLRQYTANRACVARAVAGAKVGQ